MAFLSRRCLDAPRFSPEQCAALYAAVQLDDHVDAETRLPNAIHFDYDQDQFRQCYRICRQMWKDGVDRRAFRTMVDDIARRRDLDPAQALAFKHVRAKFKHLRFAYATFGARHRYPRVFDWATQTMGRMQDAFKNGEHAKLARNAALLRLFLTPIPFAALSREIDGFAPSTVADFRSYACAQIDTIRAAIAEPAITGKQFHALRKVISRQVSFYDSLKTLYPSDYHATISRYLSAINGLMGAMHDDLVAMEMRGTRDYHADTFALPTDIRDRLRALTERFPPSV